MAIFSTLGSLIGSSAAAGKMKEGIDYGKGIWGDVKDNFKPWMDSGAQAAQETWNLLKPGSGADMPTHAQFGVDRIMNPANPFDPNAIGENFQTSPGYQFMMDEGMANINASAAAKGGLLSGATLRAGQQHATGLANQDYWNFINQTQQGMQLDTAQRQQQFANIFGVSGQGLQAAGTQGQLGVQHAGNVMNTTAQMGATQGQGISNAFGAIGKFFNPFG